MGDMVIALGMIDAIHRRFGSPVDVVASGSWAQPLLEGQSGVGDLNLVRSRRTPYVVSPKQWHLVRALRQRAMGPVWLCDRSPHARQLLTRARIPSEWIVDVHRDCPPRPREHSFDRWLRAALSSPSALPPMESADAAELIGDVTSPPLRVMPEWRVDVEAWLGARGLADSAIVLVQAGNKRTMRWWAPRQRASNTKYWPEDRWGAVIARLLKDDPRITVMLVGVPAEAALNDEIARIAGSRRVVNVARELPIPRLLALQERALGMISVDTGPAHSAAALNCPLVVLFGHSDVERWRPRSPGGAVQVLGGGPGATGGMLSVTVEDVEAAWERLQNVSRCAAHGGD